MIDFAKNEFDRGRASRDSCSDKGLRLDDEVRIDIHCGDDRIFQQVGYVEAWWEPKDGLDKVLVRVVRSLSEFEKDEDYFSDDAWVGCLFLASPYICGGYRTLQAVMAVDSKTNAIAAQADFVWKSDEMAAVEVGDEIHVEIQGNRGRKYTQLAEVIAVWRKWSVGQLAVVHINLPPSEEEASDECPGNTWLGCLFVAQCSDGDDQWQAIYPASEFTRECIQWERVQAERDKD